MTTTAAARELRCSRETVQRWCRILGYEREGRDWWITEKRLGAIRERVQPGPGNPNWGLTDSPKRDIV